MSFIKVMRQSRRANINAPVKTSAAVRATRDAVRPILHLKSVAG